MISQPQLYVERSDRLKNIARYYAMDISMTLLGHACLTRRWGRIGSRGQSKLHIFDNEQEAVSLFLEILRQKRGRGYLPTQRRHPVSVVGPYERNARLDVFGGAYHFRRSHSVSES